MSNLDVLVDTHLQLTKELREAVDDLNTRGRQVDELLCLAIVKRNEGLVHAQERDGIDFEEPFDLAATIKNLTIIDRNIRLNLKEIEQSSMLAGGLIHSVNGAAANISEVFAGRCKEAAAEIHRLKAVIALHDARLREHSLADESVRAQVWEVTGGKCFYCETQLVRGAECEGDRSNVFHVDHLVPKSAGGPDHLTNYVPSCQTCNISKSDKPVAVFLASRRQPKLTLVASS